MLPRILALLLSLVGSLISARAETFDAWVHAAPSGALTFTPWQPSENDLQRLTNNAPVQGLYGYLDLSKLPASAFPIRVRVLYGGDADREQWGGGFHQMPKPPTTFSQTTSTRVTVETAFASPDKAAAVPIWTSPIPITNLMIRTGTVFETVSVEVVGPDGAPLGRLFVGASASAGQDWNNRIAIVVNAPEVAGVFQPGGLIPTQVSSLVPDARAYDEVKTVWIDSTTAADTSLTDEFWRRLLLQGVTISGHPPEIQTLATRLGLQPSAQELLGGFIADTDPQQIANDFQKGISLNPYGGIGLGDGNIDFNAARLAGSMHRQLIDFSRWYLGLFFVCAVIVVIVSFLQLRGRRRVWLWFVIPAFSIGYALIGALAAPLFIGTRAEARIEQAELQQEGWPEAYLVTGTRQVKIDGRPATYRFPADSHLSPASGFYYNQQQLQATFRFRQTPDGSEFVSNPGASRSGEARVRSWIPAQAPIDVSADGKLTSHRDFKAAWAWDGSKWRDLGQPRSGQSLTLGEARATNAGEIQSGDYQVRERFGDFPQALQPLLTDKTAIALTTAGEGLFMGIQDIADCQLDDASSYKIESRRIVVYQFALPKGTP